MHISDGVLSPVLIATTSLVGLGLSVFAIKGTKTDEIPKISLMTALFLVGSTIRIPIGPASVHLILTGLIGLVAGRRTAAVILTALLIQLFLFQFGGISSLGANVLIEALPATLLGMTLRPKLVRSGNRSLLYGFAIGFLAVFGSVLLLSVVLIQSNLRFAMGVFSTVSTLLLAHIPLMFIEGFITAFAVRFIVRVRPDFFAATTQYNERNSHESDVE